MNHRLLNTTAITAVASFALLGAGASQAASTQALDHMMDTCIQQFVANNLADFQGKVTVHKEYSSYGPPLIAGQSNYRITVAAANGASGAKLASATCEMARDGSVISIKTVPFAALKQMQHVQSEVVAKNDAE